MFNEVRVVDGSASSMRVEALTGVLAVLLLLPRGGWNEALG